MIINRVIRVEEAWREGQDGGGKGRNGELLGMEGERGGAMEKMEDVEKERRSRERRRRWKF